MERIVIINSFVTAIKSGKFTIEEVPLEYKEEVQVILNEKQD